MNFSNYKVHASALGNIMTGSRDKDDPLGETCKSELMSEYVWEKYRRSKDFVNKFTEKGTVVEEQSMTLYSRVKRKPFFKNNETFENDYFTGTPDIITSTDIIDLKSSWDIHTFMANLHKAINTKYRWQLMAYMDMCEIESAKLVYCLVNTPDKLIIDAERKLGWDMQVIDPEADDAYQMACAQLRKEMIFDDIPIEERYIEFTIDYDYKEIDKAKKKIDLCRNFLNELADKKVPA